MQMESGVRERREQFMLRHNKRRRWYKVVCVLAGIVVFCTVYALILPAVTLGSVDPGSSAEISVGDSVELNGTESYTDNSWTVSADGIIELSESGNKATATGTSAGAVTVTHGYTTQKGNSGKTNSHTETFTLTVTSGEDENSIQIEKEDASKGYTVAVKGNTKILQGAELFVEEIDSSETEYDEYYSAMVGDIDSSLSTDVSDKDSIFDFLGLYHIYLSKDGGRTEYDPASDSALNNTNINLQVTITYDEAPEGWPSENGSLVVGHYKKTGGKIENKGFVDTDGIKQIKVSGNSVTFHIQGFSVISAAKLSDTNASETTEYNGVKIIRTSSELEADDIEGYDKDGNMWQIENVGYYEDVNGTRLIKTIRPTNIEDVFEVNVTIERDPQSTDIIDILSSLPGQEVDQNDAGINKSNPGDIIDSVGWHNGDSGLSADITKAYNSNDYWVDCVYQYKASDGTIVNLGTIRMYATNSTKDGQHHGIYQLLPNGRWLVIEPKSFKWGDTVTCTLTETQYNSFADTLTPVIGVDGITDTVDTNRFIYLGTSSSDTKEISTDNPVVTLGSVSGVPDSDGKISWTGLEELSLHKSAAMTYYVRLRTSAIDGADSDIDAMTFNGAPADNSGSCYSSGTSTVADIEMSTSSFVKKENSTASGYDIITQTYETTISAGQPSVKGLLYYIQLEKVASDSGDKLENAVFKVYRGTDTSGDPVATITTDENGAGISDRGLPWGEYTLVETKAPAGYSKTWEPTAYSLAYMGDSDSGVDYIAELVGDDKPGKSLTGANAIADDPAKDVPVAFIKLGMESDETDIGKAKMLEGAEFRLYKAKNGTREDITESCLLESSDTSGMFSQDNVRLEDGSYVLVEETAPDGYYRILDELTLLVDTSKEAPEDVVTSTSSESNIRISYSDTGDENAYQIYIINRSGVILPSTGGTGALPYTLGGTGLIVASAFMYGYSMRRRRERRLI